MDTESLQRVLKTLSDPTRIRILALLEREELAVQELMEVLSMAQSRVSRHVGILREAGLLLDRREGTFVYYRLVEPFPGVFREAWDLVRRSLADDASLQRDALALDRLLEARAESSRSFFDAVGPEWDALRKVFNDEALRAQAVSRLVPPGLRVVDVGTGTGILAAELARAGLRVVAIDHSARMLDAARTKLRAEGLSGIELRRGEATELPLEDASFDGAFAHMVLRYVPSPADAIREMARVLRPGGVAVVVDFVRHEAEWMRQELGVRWLGFDPEELSGWFRDAGLEGLRLDRHATVPRGRELPAAFLASARRP